MLEARGDRVNNRVSFKYFTRKLIKKFQSLSLNSKTGQVTVFIILGILILLAFILVILLQQEVITIPNWDSIVLGKQGVVENYITDCITSIGEDALEKAGLQGGYIEVPERYTSDISWNIQISPFLYVPLWANGPVIDQPSLDEIKIEVDEYIEENVRSCLFDGGAFETTYDIIEISEIESDVEFVNSKTVFNVKWDLLVHDKAGEVVGELIEHKAESPIRFKALYEMASAVLDTEMNYLKLEDLTQDLIALEHEDVPVAGLELSCKQKTWQVNTAESTLKEMLRINLANLKLKGTDFIEFSDDYPYYQNHYVWDVGHYDDDISAEFNFDSTYPFTFQVTPRDGNYLMSDRLGGESIISFLCIQNWKFTYDVVYPVIIELRDEESGGTFQMAFSVNLIQNFPYKGNVIARDSLTLSRATSEDYCEQSAYNVPMYVETYSMIDNGKVYYREPLENVNISYSCLKYRCDVGETTYDFEARGNVAGIYEEFPYCAAAIVRGTSDSYLEAWEYVVPDEDVVVELNLKPLKKFTLEQVEVVKHTIEEVECSDDSDEEVCYEVSDEISLAEDELAMINIKYYEDVIEESEDEESVNGEESGNETDGENVDEEILPEFVEIGDFLQDGDELHRTELIYANDMGELIMTESSFELLSGADFEYDILIYLADEDELLGGYRAKWTPVWSEFSNAEKIKFHVLEVDPSDDGLYYDFLSDMSELSLNVPLPGVSS
jgi:hypothetical protein